MKSEDARNKCAAELKRIAAQVEAEDRQKAIREFNISYVTVCRYLNGKVANLPLGINLLNLFKKRIRRRAGRVNNIIKRS